MEFRFDGLETKDDLRREVANLGLVLWSLSQGQRVETREKDLSTGLVACDLLAGLKKTISEPEVSAEASFEEAAFLERFYDPIESPIRNRRLLETAQTNLGKVREVILNLLHLKDVSAADLKLARDFCHNVYHAL